MSEINSIDPCQTLPGQKKPPIIINCWYKRGQKKFWAVAEIDIATGIGEKINITILDNNFPYDYGEFEVKFEELDFNPCVYCRFEGLASIFNLITLEVTIIDQACNYPEKSVLIEDIFDLEFPTRKEFLLINNLPSPEKKEKLIAEERGKIKKTRKYEPASGDLIFPFLYSALRQITMAN